MLQNLFKIQWVLAAAVALCLAVSLPVQAEDPPSYNTDIAEGWIDSIETVDEKTTITICSQDEFVESCTTIGAFPLGFVERELGEYFDNDDFVLDLDDCVAVKYAFDIDCNLIWPCFPNVDNVALSLTKYCPEAAEPAPEVSCNLPEDGCGGEVPAGCYCDAEGLVFRDEDLNPVIIPGHDEIEPEKNHNNNKHNNGNNKENNRPPGNKN